MTIIAKRLNKIKPSPTIAVTTKAKELKAAGKNVIGLGAGEPDFDTADYVKDAAQAAMQAGQTKYTAVDGIPELKKAIQAKFKKDNNLDYDPAEITVSCGGKQVIYNALMASLNPGDEVIIPAPYWVSYPDITILAEGTPILVNCSAADNFKLTQTSLEQAITDKTKWLILNSPSNPTGNSYSKAELSALAEILKKYPQIHILSDDIYEHITYDDFEFYNIATLAPELKKRVLIVNGVSKAYSMTGWRIGYAAGPQDLIKAMAKIQSQSTSNPCSISQYAAVAALSGPQDYLGKRNAAFKERRNFVVEQFNNTPGLSCNIPEGAFYIFASCADIIGKTTPQGKKISNSTDFASYLLEDYLVALVPGIAFGMENHFRISYATSMSNLEEACARIKEACSTLK